MELQRDRLTAAEIAGFEALMRWRDARLAELGRDRGTSGEAVRQRLARIRELLNREP